MASSTSAAVATLADLRGIETATCSRLGEIPPPTSWTTTPIATASRRTIITASSSLAEAVFAIDTTVSHWSIDVLVQKDQSRQMTTKTDTVLTERPSAWRTSGLAFFASERRLRPYFSS